MTDLGLSKIGEGEKPYGILILSYMFLKINLSHKQTKHN